MFESMLVGTFSLLGGGGSGGEFEFDLDSRTCQST
jgi:hypothetical protein